MTRVKQLVVFAVFLATANLSPSTSVPTNSTTPQAPLVLNTVTPPAWQYQQTNACWQVGDRVMTGIAGIGEMVLGGFIFAFAVDDLAQRLAPVSYAACYATAFSGGALAGRCFIGGSLNTWHAFTGKKDTGPLNYKALGIIELGEAIVCGVISLATMSGSGSMGSALLFPGCLALTGTYDLLIASDQYQRSKGYTLFQF